MIVLYRALVTVILFAGSSSFAFEVGDTVLDDFAGLVKISRILDIKLLGRRVKTTSTYGGYIRIGRLQKYEPVETYKSRTLLGRARVFEVGESVITHFGYHVRVSRILDITSGGRVETAATAGTYIRIRKLKKYESFRSYKSWTIFGRSREFEVGEHVITHFGYSPSFSRILDIIPGGRVKTTATAGTYIKASRLEKVDY